MDSIEELGRLDLPDVSIAMRVRTRTRGREIERGGNKGKRDREGRFEKKRGGKGEKEGQIEISALCQMGG